jgi:hypothetical protein
MFAFDQRYKMTPFRNIFLLLALLYLAVPPVSVKAQQFSLGVKAGPLLTRSTIADKDDRKDFSPNETSLAF